MASHSPSLQVESYIRGSIAWAKSLLLYGKERTRMMAILAAMAFSFSQVQFQHLWFDFHTLILSHILTFHYILSADSNVSFFYICCGHRLQALYTSLMTVSTEFVPS